MEKENIKKYQNIDEGCGCLLTTIAFVIFVLLIDGTIQRIILRLFNIN